MIIKFSAKELQNLHMKAEDFWRVGGKDGWQKSNVDPEEILKLYRGIWIKKGYKLVAYVYREGLRGKGVVWATKGEFPEVEDCEFVGYPKPRGAKKPEEVLEGDDSPESYISASMFLREMKEFGSLWDWMEWGLEEIIGELDLNEFELFGEYDLAPKVFVRDPVEVEFFTLHLLEGKVYRNRDIFIEGYRFRTDREVVGKNVIR